MSMVSYTDKKKKQFEADRTHAQAQPALSGGNASNGYVESDAVRQARQNLGSLQKPGAYQSQWQTSLNDTMDKILNREKFSYDLNGDALYQQYKNQYVTQGQQAMMDTMGQAAALTGGYGNSYAQSVGQQTYQGHLQKLNDKIPELYQLALDQYNREGEDLYNQYGLLADREQTDYGRYRDSVADDQWQQTFDRGVLESDRAFKYQVGRDEVADSQWQQTFDRGVLESDRAFDYQVGRDKVADSQWQQTFDRGVLESDRAFDYQVGRDKVADKQWQAEFNETVRQYDEDYKLKVQQIEEDIRHNKITEDQGQQQINLAKAEFDQRKIDAANDLAYKYAALDAKGKEDDDDDDDDYDVNTVLNDMISTGTLSNGSRVDKGSASGQAKMRSAILSEINAALKAGEITSAEAAEIKKKYAPTGSSGGRYTY